MEYNFDEVIDRRNTSAYKVDLCKTRFGAEDLLPMWVADMDFRCPDFIMQAILKRAQHEILGYTIRNKDFFAPILNWIEKKHQWKADSRWIGFSPGILPGIVVAIRTFTNPGDKIIIQPPIYPPFMSMVTNNNREIIYNQLVMKNGQYEMDFDSLESSIDDKTKMLILCSPHNPGGRVWSKTELIKLSEICYKNNILVVSDEIHADLVLEGNKHSLFPSVSESALKNSITLIAPSKTFNIAGLVTASYIIPNDNLRIQFQKQIEAAEIASGNIFAYTAATAAYEYGEDWLNQLLSYLQTNIEYVCKFLETNLPKIKPIYPEASFLIWLDFKELNLTDKEIRRLLIEECKLALNDGPSFGPGGSGFQRINIGCSIDIVKEAMNRIYNVFHKY